MTGRVEQFLVSGMWAHKDESDQMLVLELRVKELEF